LSVSLFSLQAPDASQSERLVKMLHATVYGGQRQQPPSESEMSQLLSGGTLRARAFEQKEEYRVPQAQIPPRAAPHPIQGVVPMIAGGAGMAAYNPALPIYPPPTRDECAAALGSPAAAAAPAAAASSPPQQPARPARPGAVSSAPMPPPPAAYAPPPPPPVVQRPPCPWQIAYHPDTNQPYYYHAETNETTWDKPADYYE
jgi:hypothetical protein